MSDLRQRQPGSHGGTANVRNDTLYQNQLNETFKSRSGFTLLCKISVIASIAAPLLLFALFAKFSTSKDFPTAFRLPSPPRLDGVLQLNSHLQSAERLYEGKLLGPESIVRHDGHLYTSTADGQILDIYKGQIRVVTRLGQQPCGGYDNEPTCGRPLGMRFDSDGYLVVCDAYLGLFKINVATGEHHLLLPADVRVNGQKLNFLNDLDIGLDSTIYISDSSTFQRRDLFLDVLSGRGSGRLLRYDPLHNTTKVLADRLHFANGVQLSKYEDFVLVSETTRARILKFNLKGVNAGHLTVFVENLPCLPDNIRPSFGGGFWVACGIIRHADNAFNFLDFISSRSWLQWLLSQLPAEWLMRFSKPSSMLVELSAQGEMIRVLMDPDGSRVSLSSEVEDDNGILYIGSFAEPYIARFNTNRMHN